MKTSIKTATLVGLGAALGFAQMNGRGGMMMDGQGRQGNMSDSLRQGQMHPMSGMSGQMGGMMQEMSGMIGDTSGVIDHGRMMDMSKLMSDMSKTMQEMSSQMGHGRLNPAQRKKIQVRLDAMQTRLGKLNSVDSTEKK